MYGLNPLDTVDSVCIFVWAQVAYYVESGFPGYINYHLIYFVTVLCNSPRVSSVTGIFYNMCSCFSKLIKNECYTFDCSIAHINCMDSTC